MGTAIGNVKSSAGSILSSVAGLGDVQFAVGEYKDFGDVYTYRLNTALTATQASAQSGINAWSASGGGDYQEAELFALKTLADGTPWRAGSKRILVWFGDASGHDPSGGVTEAIATTALVNNKVAALALDVGTMNDTGQPGRIAAATGGKYYASINSSDVAQKIKDAITTSVVNYSVVSLDLSEVPAGLTAELTPTDYTGTFDRTVERNFSFNLKFTAVAPGTYDFPVYATVDGGRVATERDSIQVGGGVPDGGLTAALLGIGLSGLSLLARRVRA
jgi:hypothetical protein